MLRFEDEVGDLARVLDVHHDDLQLVGQVGDHRDELGKLVHHVRLHRLEILRRLVDVGEVAHLRDEVGIVLGVVQHLDPAQTLDEDADAAVGILQHLEDAAGGAARVEPVAAGGLVLGVLLRDEAEHPVADERLLDQLERGAARDQQRCDRGGKDDDAAQREDRQLGGNLDAADVFLEPIEPLLTRLLRRLLRVELFAVSHGRPPAPFNTRAAGSTTPIVRTHSKRLDSNNETI